MARASGPKQERMPVDVARRIALAAQGLAEPRPSGRVDARLLGRTVERVGALQLDSVNVVCRSHYLPLFSRLGAYDRTVLDRMVWGRGTRGRKLFEYWGHAASILPISSYPLLRWRMDAGVRHVWGASLADWRDSDPGLHRAPWAAIAGMTRLATERPTILDEVLAVVGERGPIGAGEIEPDNRRARGSADPDPSTGRMWNWQDAKIAIEWLFYQGRIATSTRRGFERLYDLRERVIPPDVLALPTPSVEDAQRELMRIAGRSYGIGTEKQLRNVFGLPGDHAKARIAELVEAGELTAVRVEGVTQQLYAWTKAATPARVDARALLSPFDSLIWNRDRIEKLFDFFYRISIYTPEPQRVHGYYVLPFLLGERFAARVDVKADRGQAALRVPVVTYEEGSGVPEREVAAALAEELTLMAGWLELDRVLVEGRGTLAPALARAIDRR